MASSPGTSHLGGWGPPCPSIAPGAPSGTSPDFCLPKSRVEKFWRVCSTVDHAGRVWSLVPMWQAPSGRCWAAPTPCLLGECQQCSPRPPPGGLLISAYPPRSGYPPGSSGYHCPWPCAHTLSPSALGPRTGRFLAAPSAQSCREQGSFSAQGLEGALRANEDSHTLDPSFKGWLPLSAVCPEASYCSALSLSIPTHETGLTRPTSRGCFAY